ncbi:MAG: T9SS type A sorting domain-containing protein [Flavobacteriales bacterium]|nr:T9SS type A sorting domain-containing protein [Flavobacteriales bacterium]
MWTRSFSSPGLDELRCVRQAADGGFVVAGTIELDEDNSDILVLKYSAIGAFEWDEVLGGDSLESGYGVVPTLDGGYAVGGWSESFWTYRTMCMYKLNAVGDEQWVQTTTGPGGDWEGRGLVELANGDLVLAGYTEAFGAGGRDLYMWHTDANGAYLEGPTFGGLEDEEAWDVVPTGDGGYVLVGSTTGFGPGIEAVFAVRHYGAPLSSPVIEILDPLPVQELYNGGSEISTAPNPAASRGEVMLFGLDPTEHWSLSLFHASGRLVLNDMPLRQDKITLPELAPGIYTVTLRSSTNEFRSRLCVQ